MNRYNFPKGYSFVGTYLRGLKLVKNPIESMMESVDRFGESYAVYAGFSDRMILTQDPEFIDYVLKKNHKNYHKSEMLSIKLGRFIGNGLLTSNGPYWLRQRRLIQPGFHIHKIQGLYEIMQKTIDDFLVNFPTGEKIDLYPLMNRLSFEIVINTLFDIEVPPESITELSSYIRETQEFVIRDIRQPYKSWWYALSGEVDINLKKAQRTRDILRAIIRQRRESNVKFNDLLDMLLDARYEDTGEPMNEEQILDEILILVIAGHETTANVLTWTLQLLVNNPDELAKLKQSTSGMGIQECVANDRLAAVINESMRLYPPAWISDRVALEDDIFKGFSFPKGTIIALFYYGLHRNERYWENALSFSPDRFLQSDSNKEKTKAFFPFGGGPRLCIGNNFAMAEMALFLKTFIHRFEIRITESIPKILPLVTLRPVGVVLEIERANRS